MGRAKLLPYAAGALAVLLWGATPAATAVVARDVPSGLVGVARLLASAVVLAPLMLALRPKLPADKGGWAALLISASVGFAGSFACQGLGIARTSTSHAALVLTLAPVLTALAQSVLSRQWPRPLWWAGSAIAVAGVAVLILGRGIAKGGTEPTLLGDAIVFVSTVTVSIGYVAGARLSARIGLFGATAWSILLGALIILPAAPVLATALPVMTVAGASSLVFLAVGCTLVGYAAWFWALERGGVARIALLQFAQPIVSVVIAAVFLSEAVSTTVLLALALILGGVYLCRLGR